MRSSFCIVISNFSPTLGSFLSVFSMFYIHRRPRCRSKVSCNTHYQDEKRRQNKTQTVLHLDIFIRVDIEIIESIGHWIVFLIFLFKVVLGWWWQFHLAEIPCRSRGLQDLEKFWRVTYFKRIKIFECVRFRYETIVFVWYLKRLRFVLFVCIDLNII